MSGYLFVFSIAPVQGFIEQARKTQDLYAGSYILSHLCRVAIKQAESYQAELVYPCKNNRSIPNRFMAEFPESLHSELAEKGRDIEDAVRREWENMGDKVLQALAIKNAAEFREQLETYWQINWCFVKKGSEVHERAAKQAETIFGSLKNARMFRQLEQLSGRKCALSGEQNALLWCGERKPAGLVTAAAEYKCRNNGKMSEGEALGAVAAVKRFAEHCFRGGQENSYDGQFPSLAQITFMNAEMLFQASDEGKSREASLSFDHQACFAVKNKNETALLKSGESTQADIDKAREYIKALKRAKVSFPSPYYAVLLYDGDNMGKWLAGEYLREKGDLKKFQMELSRQLGGFAERTDRILSEPRGKVVYAGGDDFLGFVNIEHLFEVLHDLRTAFAKEIDLSGFTKDKLNFSAGVAIAHYKAPLGRVLSFVRQMEKKAKAEKDKNALAIGVIKHSGEIENTVLPWFDGNAIITDKLLSLFRIFKNSDLSNGFIASFCRGMQVFGKETPPDPVLQAELVRLLGRASCGSTAQEQLSENADFLFDVYRGSDLENMFSLLKIMRFLLREVKS